MDVDVFIEATGDKPNSKFLPEDWLNAKGYVKTNPETLRLDVPGVTGVYCIGAVGSYSDGSAMDWKFGLKPLLESIRLDLIGQETGKRKILYKKFKQDMQMIPIGPGGGVGTAFGYRFPSFMVKMAKAKDYMIGNAPKIIQGVV